MGLESEIATPAQLRASGGPGREAGRAWDTRWPSQGRLSACRAGVLPWAGLVCVGGAEESWLEVKAGGCFPLGAAVAELFLLLCSVGPSSAWGTCGGKCDARGYEDQLDVAWRLPAWPPAPCAPAPQEPPAHSWFLPPFQGPRGHVLAALSLGPQSPLPHLRSTDPI